MSTDPATPTTARAIVDRMDDCGFGRHVGWWSDTDGLGEQHLHIEVTPMGVTLACCEGPRAEKRIYFHMSRKRAAEVAAALTRALS